MKQLLEFLINSKSTGIIKDPDFVDLGLSVLWAKCNIGAKKETDYGHYYQWGGLEPMDNEKCSWKNTPFNLEYYDCNIKYFNIVMDKVCPNNILAKEYDIAYKTYGDKVHMPTKDEFDELISGTHNEWIDNYNNSDVYGRLFTGKNDNSIFIPAAGYKWGDSVRAISYDGVILSSSICTNNVGLVNNLSFNNNKIRTFTDYRDGAYSVRAVKDK